MRLPRWLPWAAVAVLFILLLCHEWFGPDIWYHLYLGERVARTLNPQPADNLILQQAGFINLYWIFQLLVRGVFALGGIYGVSVLFMAFWVIIGGFWLRTSGILRAGAWGPAIALAAGLLCQTRFEQRPEVLSYVFLAMQIHWLTTWKVDERPRAWEYARFALVQAIWTNVHGYFVFGPVLVGMRWLSLAAEKRKFHFSVPALFGLTLLASVASPFGLRPWGEVIAFGRVLRQLRFAIQELTPTAAVPAHVWTVDVFWCAWAAVLAAALYVTFKDARKNLFALMLAAFGLYLSTVAYRNIPLLVFLSAPLLGSILSAKKFLPRLRTAKTGSDFSRSRFFDFSTTLTAILLSLWVVAGGFYRSLGNPYGFGIRESRTAYPVSFAEYLRATGFRGSVFNPAADGGYLEFHFPDLRLYGDSRVIEVAPIREYFGALRDPARFRELQSRCGFDGALLAIAESRKVVAALLREKAWRLAEADLHRAFFVNTLGPPGRNAAIHEPVFYAGEDLSLPQNEAAAVLWVAIFVEVNDRENLLRALRQFSSAPAIPSALAELALNYGWRKSDREAIAVAKAMRPRVFPTRSISAATIGQLLGP